MRTTRYVRRRRSTRARLDAVAFVVVLLGSFVGLSYVSRRPIIATPRRLPLVAEWGDCGRVEAACRIHGTPYQVLWTGPRACEATFQCGRFIPQGHCLVNDDDC